jgi:hypothetical protein
MYSEDLTVIEDIAIRVNRNAALVRRGRRINLKFLLGVGDEDYIVTIHSGRIEAIALRGLATDCGKFSIRAAREVWVDFWRPLPPRDRHDVFSMVAAGLATFDGDLLPLMQNLQYFKDLLASPRPILED